MPSPSKTTPAAILRAAIAIVETKGWGSLSLRALARPLGLQVTSLYHHFPDKKALEDALGQEAARRLHRRLSAPAVRGNIERMAATYVNFARRHKGLYQLIAGRTSSTDSSPQAKLIWNLLLEAVGCVSGETDDTAAAIALWSYIHGFVALEAAGKFGVSGAGGGFEKGIRALEIGLGQKPPRRRVSVPR